MTGLGALGNVVARARDAGCLITRADGRLRIIVDDHTTIVAYEPVDPAELAASLRRSGVAL